MWWKQKSITSYMFNKCNSASFVNREVKAEETELNQTELKIGKRYSKQLFLTITLYNFTDEVV